MHSLLPIVLVAAHRYHNTIHCLGLPVTPCFYKNNRITYISGRLWPCLPTWGAKLFAQSTTWACGRILCSQHVNAISTQWCCQLHLNPAMHAVVHHRHVRYTHGTRDMGTDCFNYEFPSTELVTWALAVVITNSRQWNSGCGQ